MADTTTNTGDPLKVPAGAPEWVQYEAERGVFCTTCGREAVGVKAHASGFDYCRDCYHTGAAYEDIRGDQLYRFRSLMPDWDVEIWHTGGGCFMLRFEPPGEHHYYYGATDGEASLPDLDGKPILDGWGIVIRYWYDPEDDEASNEHPDFEGTIVTEPSAPEATTDTGWPSDAYWNEYPRYCLTDTQIVGAMLADWEKVKP